MSFAAVSLRQESIVGHVVLVRRLENARCTRSEYISPRNHVHSFRFESCEELGSRGAWLASPGLPCGAAAAFIEVGAELKKQIDPPSAGSR